MPQQSRPLIVDYRLFGAPLPRADALARALPVAGWWPRLGTRTDLLTGHWSLSRGHWSAELAAYHRCTYAKRPPRRGDMPPER